MKEKEFISIIKNITGSEYIGDDCAYLKDFGITISQDSLVEDVHFKKDFITPFQLGYKTAMVNISDISASGAQPKYMTISLSLPNETNSSFVKEFYDGIKKACANNIKVVGGDITSASKIYISAGIIGDTRGRKVSSRKNAKVGYKVVVSGLHGSSSAGLKLLLENKKEPKKFIKAHLEPEAQINFGNNAGLFIKDDYAMMDTSDGLAEALSEIAYQSGVLLDIDFNKIPYDKDLEQFKNWEEMVLFGGEDYGMVAVVPEYFDGGTTIGKVIEGEGINIKMNNKVIHYTKKDIDNKIFNHFEEER